jgi:FkbM family methyltransferase
VALGRQLQYLWQRHVRRRPLMLADGLPLDMRFAFNSADDVGRHLFKYRRYEPHVLGYLQTLPPPCAPSLLLDIGANLGWYSTVGKRLWGDRVQVHAFEPEPQNRALLEHNLALNGLSDVQVVDAALSDYLGGGELNLYRALNQGKHSLLPLQGAVGSVPTRVLTLDHYLASLALDSQPVAFIKLDVEGLEPAVVRGARQALGRTGLLMLEYSPMYYQQRDAKQMVEALFAEGFELLVPGAQGWQPASAAQLLSLQRQVDTLWRRPQPAG